MTDPWERLRKATPARIGLGRSGAGLPTTKHLEFQFAHARARDAVHCTLDWDQLEQDLAPLETIRVRSQAQDRSTYLRRPDLGRKVSEPLEDNQADVAIIIADGLSSTAVQAHAPAVTHGLVQALPQFSISPIVIASHARVAIGDEIGEQLNARLSIVLVGERPGLTVADSLGAYITYAPKPGRMDSERNCVSNIHGQGGLSSDAAVHKIAWLSNEALRRHLTGTELKENAGVDLLDDEDKPSLS